MNILVTGGGSGLGEAILRKLSAVKSDKVFFTFCNANEKAKSIEKDLSNAEGIQCDFKNTQELDNLVERVQSMDLDILINNAITGINVEHFHKMNADLFLSSFQDNALPVIRITQQAIMNFRKKRFGKIITILTSGLINTPPLGYSEYTAMKAYIASLSKSWATENAEFNITSNCISPSFMNTHLTASIDERILEGLIDKHPLKKLLTVEEVADSVFFLSKCTQQMNGINLIMNSAADVV